MVFSLFILLNAVMLIWPVQLFPALISVPLYEVVILACLVLSYPALVEQATLRSFAERPISVCVLGIVAVALLTDLAHGLLGAEAAAGIGMLKILPYYLLLVAIVNSPARLRRFLWSFVGIAVLITGLAVAHFHGLITIPAIHVLEDIESFDPATGTYTFSRRLVGIGVFGGDPNDMCLMLTMAISICVAELTARRPLPLRLAWLAPIVLFGHALMMTRSRGGLLATLAATGIYLVVRVGWRKAAPMLAVALPVGAVFFGGRQTNFDIAGGTGQQRIRMWGETLNLFFHNPVLGVGTGMLEELVVQVTHNSFLHCYGEMGFVGGTCFVGAFYLAVRTLQQLGSAGVRIPDPELRRLRPCLLALVAGYCMGMMSLSRAYTVPTYLVLGTVTAYLRMVDVAPPLPIQRFDARRLVVASVTFLVVAYLYVRYFIRWG